MFCFIERLKASKDLKLFKLDLIINISKVLCSVFAYTINLYFFVLVFSNLKVQGKDAFLDKIVEVVEIMKKSISDAGLQLAGMKYICKLLDGEAPQERSIPRSDSAQSNR